MQTSDPSSPMQVVYSPPQPVYSDTTKLPMYQSNNYSQPPPNYAEAIGLQDYPPHIQVHPENSYYPMTEFTAQ